MGDEGRTAVSAAAVVNDDVGGGQEKGKNEEENSRPHRKQILGQQRLEVKRSPWLHACISQPLRVQEKIESLTDEAGSHFAKNVFANVKPRVSEG
jgi:hypothetical protein